jgi:hypothetical protein
MPRSQDRLWRPPPYHYLRPRSFKDDCLCNLRRGALPLWVWRARCGLARPSPLCTTISNLLPPLRPLHTALSSPAHSHAFCHADLNRRPGHHPPGRASSSPAKAVWRPSCLTLSRPVSLIPSLTPTSTCSRTALQSLIRPTPRCDLPDLPDLPRPTA